MKLSLKATPKWLFVPPAVALLLVLGPLSMQGKPANAEAAARAPAATDTAKDLANDVSDDSSPRTSRSLPALPRTPDLWQMSSALVGVLLLGIGGILVLRKLRGGASPVRGASPIVTLRQTLRLSGKQAVHAIEFDDRVLLIGEHERGLALLDSGRLPDRASDEAQVLARGGAESHGDDDGAVPKDLVIPRPPHRQTPKPARAPATAGAAAKNVPLEDFRTLLQKVGRA